MARRVDNAVAVSLGLHALLALGAWQMSRRAPRVQGPSAVSPVEVEYLPTVPLARDRPDAPTPPAAVSLRAVPAAPPPARAVPAQAAPSARGAPTAPETPPPRLTVVPSVAPLQAPPSTPPSAPTSSVPTAINGLALLRETSADAERLVDTGVLHFATAVPPMPSRDLVPREQGSPQERAVAASDGYVRSLLAGTHHHEPPGVRDYYWYLHRRMEERWTPGISRQPSLLDTLVGTLGLPAAAQAQVDAAAQGQFVTPGPAGAAADALDSAHGPHGSPQVPFRGIVDASHGNVRLTRTEVEVDQDAEGHVRSVRIVRSSRIHSFDDAALEAVRAALPLQAPVAMPGGRRSRWSFQVAASRDPFVPGLGIEFDESSGWFEVHYPGRLHIRSRVWLEQSSPLGS